MRGDTGASKHADEVLVEERAAAEPIATQAPAAAGEVAPHASLGFAGPIGGWIKRAFDIGFAAGALAILSPVLFLIALAIRLDSPGSAIFKQERGGFGGRKFRIWKFRTMRVKEDGDAVRQCIRDDDRITRVGRVLRRTSLDEFPQLVNVLIGDMSLVGPRPHAVAHDKEFGALDPRYPIRTRARPGMTGLAQVVGFRGPTSTSEAIRGRTGCDVDYVEHWSFSHDIRILARTAKVLWNDPHAF